LPKRPPSEWFTKVQRSLRQQYPKYSPERLDKIAAGIWHGFSPKKQESLTRKLEKSARMREKATKTLIAACKQVGLTDTLAKFLARKILKDFGGWTSHNLDWERGYREGERKAEDRQRGLRVQRTREPQLVGKPCPFAGKQSQQLTYATEEDNSVREEQEKQKRQALRYRAGEFKEQHQGVGEVPIAPGSSTKPKPPPAFKPKSVRRIKRFSIFVPIDVKLATKSYAGGVQRGDLIVEGFVSMPVKDLQGDILELPALVKAKNEMVRAPHNLVWLDHESPYARPTENQSTPPIGKFVTSKIMRYQGFPALWVRMLVNKAHPRYREVGYELKNGFYNAFSMEFVPVREGVKWIRGKLANAISDIKYFATSLVRAPANEGATITSVYQKAFANSSQFYPVQVAGPGWIGQSVRIKGVEGKLPKYTLRKEAEPEVEPEEEPEAEPELEPEEEPGAEPAEEREEEPDPLKMQYPYSRKDYDRETGSTAPERASTAIGEWGDPALEKARAVLKDHAQRLGKLEKYASASGRMLKALMGNTSMIAKALGVEVKGIDEDTPEAVEWEDIGPGSSDLEEQVPPEVKPGKLKPDRQRIISSIEPGDEDVEDTETQKVKGLHRAIVGLVRKEVDRAVGRKIVVRKGFAEYAGAISESVERQRAMQNDDGSIESQLGVVG